MFKHLRISRWAVVVEITCKQKWFLCRFEIFTLLLNVVNPALSNQPKTALHNSGSSSASLNETFTFALTDRTRWITSMCLEVLERSTHWEGCTLGKCQTKIWKNVPGNRRPGKCMSRFSQFLIGRGEQFAVERYPWHFANNSEALDTIPVLHLKTDSRSRSRYRS